MVSLAGLVPKDILYRHLDAKLDPSFVRACVQERSAERGRPSIDPVAFSKHQGAHFFGGPRSQRKLMEALALDLARHWYVGYGLDGPLPDHSNLSGSCARFSCHRRT